MGGASDGDLLESTVPKRVRLPAIGVCAEACDLFDEGGLVRLDGRRWLLAVCVIMLWTSVTGCPLLFTVFIPLSSLGSA